MANVEVSVVALQRAWQVLRDIEGILMDKVVADDRSKLTGEWNPRKSEVRKKKDVDQYEYYEYLDYYFNTWIKIFQDLDYIGIWREPLFCSLDPSIYICRFLPSSDLDGRHFHCIQKQHNQHMLCYY